MNYEAKILKKFELANMTIGASRILFIVVAFRKHINCPVAYHIIYID